MNLPIAEALQRLRAEGNWTSRFQQVYGELPNERSLPNALAAFQATQFSPKTRYDDFKAGSLTALSATEQRGLLLFEGKARCSGCHGGRNFTDESFRSNGLVENGDIGRSDATARERDYKLFKVPTLRSVRSTAPYMHDGSLASLRDVVNGYNTGSRALVTTDTDIRPLELSSQEINDLLAFLNAI
jgi:cytochrome c peroxidase